MGGDSTVSNMYCVYSCSNCNQHYDMVHHLELKLTILCNLCKAPMRLNWQVLETNIYG